MEFHEGPVYLGTIIDANINHKYGLSTCICRSFLILRIAYKQVKEGVTEDVREQG